MLPAGPGGASSRMERLRTDLFKAKSNQSQQGQKRARGEMLEMKLLAWPRATSSEKKQET